MTDPDDDDDRLHDLIDPEPDPEAATQQPPDEEDEAPPPGPDHPTEGPAPTS